jgi:hypothetical protein
VVLAEEAAQAAADPAGDVDAAVVGGRAVAPMARVAATDRAAIAAKVREEPRDRTRARRVVAGHGADAGREGAVAAGAAAGAAAATNR